MEDTTFFIDEAYKVVGRENMPETSKLKKFETEFLPGSKNSGIKVINENPIFFDENELNIAQISYCDELNLLANIIISGLDKNDISYVLPCGSEQYGVCINKNTTQRKRVKIIKTFSLSKK